MKKILVVAIVMIVSLNMSKAQTGVSFGIKAGINLENVSGYNTTANVPGYESNGTTSLNIGFHIGGVLRLAFTPEWSFMPELLYSTGGEKQTLEQTIIVNGITYNSSVTGTTSLSYIQIPFLLNYKMGGGLNFSFGPYLSMLVGSNSSTSSNVNGETINITSSSDTANNKVDLGLGFGIGYQSSIGLGIGIRYDLGLTTVYKASTYNGSGVYYTQPASGKNDVLQISIDYMF